MTDIHQLRRLLSASGGCASSRLESIEKMRTALKDAHQPSEIIVYPDTPHGFNADYRPTYRKQPAEDGWKRMLDWFKKNGVS